MPIPRVPADGKPGADGATGRAGAEGAPGKTGRAGVDGIAGKRGVAGPEAIPTRDPRLTLLDQLLLAALVVGIVVNIWILGGLHRIGNANDTRTRIICKVAAAQGITIPECATWLAP